MTVSYEQNALKEANMGDWKVQIIIALINALINALGRVLEVIVRWLLGG